MGPATGSTENATINFANSEKSDTFAILNRKAQPLRPGSSPDTALRNGRSQVQTTPARMAESVDALVSNTSGAIRAGSIPAPGTKNTL